jgi:hypothetical protein
VLQHQASSLTSCEKAGIAGHLPDFAEYPLGGVEQWEAHVGADIKYADFERRPLIGIRQERDDLLLFARVERPTEDAAARYFDLLDQWCEFATIAPPDEQGKAFGR